MELLIIRAGYFYDNWEFTIRDVISGKSDSLDSFIPSEGLTHKIGMVSPKDIARVIAEWMQKDELGGVKVVQITGPVELSSLDVAEITGKVVGRKIDVKGTDEEGVKGMGQAMGWSDVSVEAWVETMRALGSGIIKALEGPDIVTVRGEVRFDDYVKELL